MSLVSRGLLLAFILPSLSWAQSSLLDEIPDHFSESFNATMLQVGLGHSCASVATIRDELPCNPAFLAGEKGKSFVAGGHLGNDYKRLQDYRRLLDEDRSLELVERLFEEESAVRARAGGTLSFRFKGWGFSFTPRRFSHFSVVRNRSHPQMGLHNLEETALRVQRGWQIKENWLVGLQLRAQNRRYVHDSFSLLEAAADTGGFLETEEQRAFYIEPSVVWRNMSSNWRPRWSIMASNLGHTDNRATDIELTPIVDTGVGVEAPLAWGDWDLTLNYRWKKDEPNEWDSLRLATLSHWGIFQTLFAYSAQNTNTGIYVDLKSTRIGVLYQNDRIKDIDGDTKHDNALYGDFSIIF